MRDARLDVPPDRTIPIDGGMPHPMTPVWPLAPELEWLRFQEEWAGVIPPPANLIAIYQHVLALAIFEKLRDRKNV